VSLRVFVQLAKSKEEHEQALCLLQKARKIHGLAPHEAASIWLTKQHALPSSNTIIAVSEGTVVGAISLFGESAFCLPIEEEADLAPFRAGLVGRVAELSLPAVAPSPNSDSIIFSLYHYALCFGSSYCHYDAFVTHLPSSLAEQLCPLLQLKPLMLNTMLSGSALHRNARENCDIRKHFQPGFEASFRFPEKKFFLVAHQSIEPETLDFLFNKKTALFETMTDLEIRVLKNIYDHGEFASTLPERPLNLPFKKTPKLRRFPMNCEGFLRTSKGEKINLQVLDVSRDGLKIRLEEEMLPGTYPLNLSIGVLKQAEVIASTVWIDEIALIAGLQIKSGCRHWHKLIEYLEQESQKSAA